MALRRIASALGKLGAAAAVAAVFAVGLLATVYLSIRSPEIQVPEVVNKSYTDGEATLEKAGLDIRERAKRYKPDVQPGIILDQSPRAGETIKAGQTIAVVVSRGPKEGEQQPPAEEADGAKNDNAKANENSGEDSNKNDNKNDNKNENANRERPRNTNRNSNRNSNSNTAANLNRNANARNANLNANRGANSNRSLNTNANAGRPRTTTNTNTRNANAAGPRNASPARPAANANRRP